VSLILLRCLAAGLGKLSVLSQWQRSERKSRSFLCSAVKATRLGARLASGELFRQANIDLNPALLSMKFAFSAAPAAIRDDSHVRQPINEPFLDMLVELSGRTDVSFVNTLSCSIP